MVKETLLLSQSNTDWTAFNKPVFYVLLQQKAVKAGQDDKA